MNTFKQFLEESKELDRARELGFNVDVPLYHGTVHDIDAIDPKHFGKGNDILGPGFYMTTDPNDADTYAGSKDGANILKVYSAIKNPMPTNFVFNKRHIRHILSNAPNLSETLLNFKNRDNESDEITLNNVINMFHSGQDKHDNENGTRTLNLINNDFYKGHEAELLAATHKTTKFDGVIVQKNDTVQHHVAWFPDQVRVAHARFSKFGNGSKLSS